MVIPVVDSEEEHILHTYYVHTHILTSTTHCSPTAPTCSVTARGATQGTPFSPSPYLHSLVNLSLSVSLSSLLSLSLPLPVSLSLPLPVSLSRSLSLSLSLFHLSFIPHPSLHLWVSLPPLTCCASPPPPSTSAPPPAPPPPPRSDPEELSYSITYFYP